MPDWDTHARVAVLLGYKPDRRVDKVIDNFKLHDIGLKVVEKPALKSEDLVSPRRLRRYRGIILASWNTWQGTTSYSTSITRSIA